MNDKFTNSPKNRPTPAQPTHVLIKIAGGCLILASIAAIAVEIRGWMIEPGNTQEYLSQEIRDRVSSKPTWHYSDPIRQSGKELDSTSNEQLPPTNEESPLGNEEGKQLEETVVEAEAGSQNDRNSPSELAQQFRTRYTCPVDMTKGFVNNQGTN